MQGMGDILRQAKVMQEKMAKMQQELESKTVEGSSGGGMVRVVCNGKQEVLSISIEKEVVDPEDVDMLQDMILAAVNDGLRNARSLVEREMGALTGGLNLPGLF